MAQKQLSPFEEKLNLFFAKYLSRIPFVQKTFFVEHIRVMIGAGLSVIEALSVLSKEIENKKFKLVIGVIKADVESGQQLSQALKKHPKVFPSMYVNMIEAGELAGKLEESLQQVEIQMKKSHELASSIRGAMIYPSVVLVAMSGVGVLMATVVLPKLLTIFSEFDSELPFATRALIAIINVVSNPVFLTIIIAALVTFVVLFAMALKRSAAFRFAIHTINLKLPIVGAVIKKINLARFSMTLSSLMKSTIPIIKATEITAQTCSNVVYRTRLMEASKEIQTGTPLSEILNRHPELFPPMVGEMIMVGERSGEVDKLLEELASFYSNEVSKTMKNFSVIIEPVIIIVLGLAVAGMAVAVIMPLYTLVQDF